MDCENSYGSLTCSFRCGDEFIDSDNPKRTGLFNTFNSYVYDFFDVKQKVREQKLKRITKI